MSLSLFCLYVIFAASLLIMSFMSKSMEHKKRSVFLRILEDKRAIRKCVQEGGDVKKLAKERGIKFSTLL